MVDEIDRIPQAWITGWHQWLPGYLPDQQAEKDTADTHERRHVQPGPMWSVVMQAGHYQPVQVKPMHYQKQAGHDLQYQRIALGCPE